MPYPTAEAEVVQLCQELMCIDTTNYGDDSGPGERLAAEYVAERLSEVGIEPQLIEHSPRRTSVVAHWGGDIGAPVLLHGHLDVVPAEAADWQYPPFAAEIVDGTIWGRGAVDMKNFDAMLLAIIRQRQREQRTPQRPYVIAFTADEEAGGAHGAGVLVEHHRELFEGCVAAIGEVGGFSVTARDQRFYLIQAAEKGMAWMRLRAAGAAGHGSLQHPNNAVTRLAAAVARIGQHEWPVQLTAPMEVLLGAIGELVGTAPTPENADELLAEFGPAARMLGATIRHTTNPTILRAGYKTNVVPQQATAEIDGRFLPGFETQFWRELHSLVGPDIEVEPIVHMEPVASEFTGKIPAAINQALLAEDPGAKVVPYLMTGGTDGKYWSRLGMQCFGFVPLQLPPELDFTALFHGVDERLPIDALQFGVRTFDRFLDQLEPAAGEHS